MKNLLKSSLAFVLIFLFQNLSSNEVNIYTSRHYDSDDLLYKDFSNSTGIKVNIISGKGEALIERLKSEGSNSSADIFLTSDAGNLWKVQKEGLFKSIASKEIMQSVPVNLRGPNNEWIGIAKRARVIFYNPDNVVSKDIENLSYEDLAKETWKNRIVVRSSNNIYNQSLVASMISNNGIADTEKWAKKFVSNFARKPQGNDRSQIIAVANGEADIAIANSYYFGIMLSGSAGPDQLKAAKKVKMIFPNQKNRGTHVNISGAGVLRNSKNPMNAEAFLEFLLSSKAQSHIVNNTYEYPVIDIISPSPVIAQFGTSFMEDKTSASDFGKFNSDAIKLMDRVGWK
ncbi:MAG: extracellular solute-binding protein [Gammaproteobacteria bacterium]|nr:extracellular solute-binding protein [Gammaproteobacteria bacterium]